LYKIIWSLCWQSFGRFLGDFGLRFGRFNLQNNSVTLLADVVKAKRRAILAESLAADLI
jgi:hypothetical protein